MKQQYYGSEHVQTTNALMNIGIVYKSQGRFEEALGLYKRALSIRHEHYGEGHPETASLIMNIGNVYLGQGRYE